LPDSSSDGGRVKPHGCEDEVVFIDSTQVSNSFSKGQGVGSSMLKTCGSHAPRLDVRVAVASGDGEDHPTAKSVEMLVRSVVVPWALSDTEALQGVDKKAGKTRLLLSHALGPSIFSHLKTKVELNKFFKG
jgi:hypothetical protein